MYEDRNQIMTQKFTKNISYKEVTYIPIPRAVN